MTKPLEMTRFFSGKQRPWEPGVYLRKSIYNIPSWAYWNGTYWCRNSTTKELAFENGKIGARSGYDSLKWRGLTEAEYKREIKKAK